MKMKYQDFFKCNHHHVIIGLIACWMLITPVDAKHNITRCNSTLDTPIGQVNYISANKSDTCMFRIEHPKNSTQIYLLLERLTLFEKDSLIIRASENSTDSLFEFSSSVNVVTPLITSQKNLFLQLDISDSPGKREVVMYYQSQACILSFPPDSDLLTFPVYEKNYSLKQLSKCEIIFNSDSNKNFSYAFIFEKVNINSTSQVTFQDIQPSNDIAGPKSLAPFDAFGAKGPKTLPTISMEFVVNSSNDQLLIRVEKVLKECSAYFDVSGGIEKQSPQIEEIPDGVDGFCRWFFGSSKGVLGVEFKSVNFTNKLDIASVTDGGYSGASPFYQITSLSQKEALTRQIRTSSSMVMISFKPVSFMKSNLSFSVFLDEQGKYMKGKGSINGVGDASQKEDVIYLLEVEKDQNVLLNFIGSTLSGSTVLEVYDDFSTTSNKIASLTGNIWYPILSPTSRMMIQAVNFVKEQSFEATFNGTAPGCMHMSPGKSDSYVLSGHCNSTCAWIIPPLELKQDLQLELQYFALESDDKIQVFKLDQKKTVLANITHGMSHLPTLSLDPKTGAYVEVTRGKCEKADDIILVAQVSYVPGCSKNYTLSPNEKVVLTSPNYPNTYPLFDLCQYGISRASPNMYMYIGFQQLQLASDHCINIKQIPKNGTEHKYAINGNNMPDDIIFFGDAVIEFNSKKCNSTKALKEGNVLVTDQGFVLNLLSTDCGGLLESDKGTLESVVNKSLCIWKISIAAGDSSDGSVNVILFSIKHKSDVGNYNLTVYDGGSMRSNKLENLTSEELWSKTNHLLISYQVLDLAKPASVVTIDYKTMSCNKSMQCDNKICMHPDWRCNGKNDCGDFSDERSCASVPLPPGGGGDDSSSGISGTVFGICIIVFFLFGILLAIALPKVMDRIRNGRYSQFRDVSVVE